MSKIEKIKCVCGKTATKNTVKYNDQKVPGWKCQNCGEEYIHPKYSLKISKKK
jgi:hypothetical protein